MQISPEDFSKLSAVAIEDNINEKYANKVSAQLIKKLSTVADMAPPGNSKDRPMYRLLRLVRVVRWAHWPW